MTNPFDCKIQKTPKIPKVIDRLKINDRVITQSKIGTEIITTRSVPLVPDDIPANQKPISTQQMATIFSTIFEILLKRCLNLR